MIAPSSKQLRILGLLGALLSVSTPRLQAQTATPDALAVVEGEVQNAQKASVAATLVTLSATDSNYNRKGRTDSKGHFRFEGVPTGSYTIRAELSGYEECRKGPFSLSEHETKAIELLLIKSRTTDELKDSSNAIAFSDEPDFVVAGVTDTTALGGHGSAPVIRNSNALSKETASLAHGEASTNTAASETSAQEAAIRSALAKEDTADLHAELAEIEEREGRPLEAVKEYQRAAELQPTEAHLFSWGAELLLHHAPEPAIEVFTKGRRLYPQSGRMLLGLGAAWYAQRSNEQAAQIFLEACDLHPNDPTPYLFLGRLQVTEQIVPPAWTERMKRFTSLLPEDAMAHYLYAVALSKQGGHAVHSDVAQSELKKAIELDPHLGDAYLWLGILLMEKNDYLDAVTALQKAVENTVLPDEAHYRLAQVYRHLGETDKARNEIELYKKLTEQKSEQAERDRHEIPQFVYTLRGQTVSSPPTDVRPQ